jgi:putative Mg2+ transporter-C (MgtC) family protein
MCSALDFTLQAGEPALFLRLLIATCAGGMVGWNRYRAGKPAGTGTHALVALGAAIFVAIPVTATSLHGGDGATRVIQGVAAGIGFLGAGEIFRDPTASSRVQGLTSAAALWATAALGILAVCGSGPTILAATTLVLAILYLAPRLEHQLPPKIPMKPSPGGLGAEGVQARRGFKRAPLHTRSNSIR